MDAEKIICCDRGCDYNPMAYAFMNGRNNAFGDNFAELFVLLLASRMFGGFGGFGEYGFNGQGQQNIEVQNQLQAIRTQLQDSQTLNCLQRAVDGNAADIRQLANTVGCNFNTMMQCCCDLKQALATIGGQIGYSKEAVINAVNSGDSQVIQAIKDCCCGTQKEILKMGYEQQLATCHQTNELRSGQRDLGVAITEGLSKVGYQQAADKCDIIRAGQDNAQRIIDTLNSHWKDEQTAQIQDLKFQLSQERQTRMIERMGRGNWGRNGDCGCSDGCGF